MGSTSAGRPLGAGRRRDQAGQITAMLIIFCMCLLLVVVAVTDLSAGYLRRQSAGSLADGAALAATSAAAAGSIYGGQHDRYVPIDPVAARAAVRTYFTRTRAFVHYPGLRYGVTVTGHVVTVWLSMPFTLPVPVPGVRRTTTVHGVSSAELPIY